jgi:hypothetical protein
VKVCASARTRFPDADYSQGCNTIIEVNLRES